MHTAEKRAGVGKDKKNFPSRAMCSLFGISGAATRTWENFGDATILKTFGEVPENLDEL